MDDRAKIRARTVSDIEECILSVAMGDRVHHAHDIWLDTCSHMRAHGVEVQRKDWERAVTGLLKKGWLRATPHIPCLQTTVEGQKAKQSNYLERTAPSQSGGST